jgi:hypothetical protein
MDTSKKKNRPDVRDLRPKFRSLYDAWAEFRDSDQERYQ